MAMVADVWWPSKSGDKSGTSNLWWPTTMALDTPFLGVAGLAGLTAFWGTPYTASAWLLFGSVWMLWLGTPAKCCLPWLPNGD